MIVQRLEGPGRGPFVPANAPLGAGAVRLLLAGLPVMGCRNDFEELESYLEGDDRFATWVVRLGKSPGHLALGAAWPGLRGRDLYQARQMALWRARLGRWLGSPEELASSFDLVVWLRPPQALVSARPGSPPFVVLMDSTLAQKRREFGLRAQDTRIALAWERRLTRDAALVVGSSEWVLESAQRDYGIGPNRLYHLANGLTRVEAEPRRAGGGLPRLVFVGNDWRRKGGHELLELHQRRFSELAELHVVSRQVAERSGLRRVVFHRHADRDEVRRSLLPSMDLFVFPTRMDMVPWVVLEAAEAGLPVVTYGVGGMRELVEHGRTGFVLPPGERAELAAAVERLLLDEELRRSFGDAARQRVRDRFDGRRVYPAALDRFHRLATSGR